MKLKHPLFAYAICYVGFGLCDTEVVNFLATPQDSISVESLRPDQWLSIVPSTQPLLLEVVARGEAYASMECGLGVDTPPGLCPGDVWVVLDLSENKTRIASWAPASHSLRVSWPASSPANFHIRIYDHPQIATLLNITTSSSATSSSYSRFARIRAHHRGVLPSSHPNALQDVKVPYHLVFEPLVLGVLPASLTPTILTLLVVALLASLGAPYVVRYLQQVASAASSELAQRQKDT